MLKNTLKYFYEISKIPRCSKKEEKIREYLVSWAWKNNLEYKIDKMWNLLVLVEASETREKEEGICLQGHIDMVCVKSKNSWHDFSKDEIKVSEKDWFLVAENTTLWADNGVWIAISMAAIHLQNHPKLELLFTVDEEKWMSWALGLEENFINSKRLINLDTEDEGEITIASAWWVRMEIKKNIWEKNISLKNIFKINILGLKWWHSWIEIHKVKIDAITLFFELLENLKEDFELVKINSWVAENAISNSLEAVFWINLEEEKLKNFLEKFEKESREKFLEENLKIVLKKSLSPESSLPDREKGAAKIEKSIWIKNSKKLMISILSDKTGVYKMSGQIKDFVISSQNLWILELENWNIQMQFLLRSSLLEDLEKLIENKKENFWELFWEENILEKDKYLGWQENSNSELLKLTKNSYEKIYGKKVKILWVHAGLECWTIVSKMKKESEAVSIWPNLFWAHTTEERCEIKSIELICEIVKDILKK